jgi:sugar phosphate isomerase/epimerase
MQRRDAIRVLGAAVATVAVPSVSRAKAAATRRCAMGMVAYTVATRRSQSQASGDLYRPAQLLEHCRSIGLGGIQTDCGILDDAAADALRSRAAELELYVEAIVKVPQGEADIERFDAAIRTAARVGALAARTTIISGRRYEQFDDLATFREFAARGKRSLEWARPILEKHRFPLAVENHKDQRLDERLALYRELNCEFIGATVDTGNNIALLDDPLATVEALAPYAFSVHLKDQAVAPYDEGFLLGDVPLGQGYLDLKKMVAALRSAKPKIRFSLELITRDPLKVPCLTEKFWATFPTVPGGDLARTLRDVRTSTTDKLGQIAGLSPQDMLAREDANIAESLAYAMSELGL